MISYHTELLKRKIFLIISGEYPESLAEKDKIEN